MSDFPCVACGFLVLGEPPGSYEICDVCGWEDDHVQLAHPAMRGGANRESLAEAQQRSLALIPLEVRSYAGFERSPAWRPLQAGDSGYEPSAGSPRDGATYFEAASKDSAPYYWQVSGPQMLESILADVDVRAPGKSAFQLWIPDQLSFHKELVAQDLAMALLLDRLLAHGLFPAGFAQHSGGRVYFYTSDGQLGADPQG